MNAPVLAPGGKIDAEKTLKPVKVAVLTISDTRDAESDTSGNLLASRVTGAGHDLAAKGIVKDDVDQIRAQILTWVDDPTHPVWSAEELQRHQPKSELFNAKGYADFQTIPQRIRRFVVSTIHYQPPPIHY